MFSPGLSLFPLLPLHLPQQGPKGGAGRGLHLGAERDPGERGRVRAHGRPGMAPTREPEVSAGESLPWVPPRVPGPRGAGRSTPPRRPPVLRGRGAAQPTRLPRPWRARAGLEPADPRLPLLHRPLAGRRRGARSGRAVMTLGRRRAGAAKRAAPPGRAAAAAATERRAWPSWAPSRRFPSVSSPPPSSRPSTRSRRATSASTTGEAGPTASHSPPGRARSGPPLTALCFLPSFLPQRRGVADLHQRARLPPHAALHHVLQVSAGAAGPLPARPPGTGPCRRVGSGSGGLPPPRARRRRGVAG